MHPIPLQSLLKLSIPVRLFSQTIFSKSPQIPKSKTLIQKTFIGQNSALKYPTKHKNVATTLLQRRAVGSIDIVSLVGMKVLQILVDNVVPT